MKARLLLSICLFSASCLFSTAFAQRFGKVDNLFEYLVKKQFEKFEKVRPDLKPKELETFKTEIEYLDQLHKTVSGNVDDFYEGYFQSYVQVSAQATFANITLICSGMKIQPDSLKKLADEKIMQTLQTSDNIQKQGRGVLAALEKTAYPVGLRFKNDITDMVFNSQYSELLTTPTLDKYRAFIRDWPKTDKLPSVRQNYDDALFAESQNSKNKDLYLLDEVIPNENKRHMQPDDWAILGDKQAENGDYKQAVVFYNKSIAQGSKEGLFKLTLLKYDGKIESDEDELIIFQKLANAGDDRAKELVGKIQNKTLNLAVEGSLASLISKKDKSRVVSIILGGDVNTDDLKVLREMATGGALAKLDMTKARISKFPDKAFMGCKNLTELKLPQCLKSIGNEAFADCGSLTALALPDSLIEMMGSAFNNCYSLTEMKIPSMLSKGLGFVSFCTGCTRLNQFTVDESNSAYSALDGVLYNKDKTIILRYPSGKDASLYSFPNTVAEVGYGAFEGCRFLSLITMTEKLKTIRSYAFKGCSRLTSINIPSMVGEIGAGAFQDCDKLTAIVLPTFITEISTALFKNCSSLNELIVPASVREIRSEAFSGCTNLASVNMGADVKGFGDKVFQGCTSLRSIRTAQAVPQSITSIFEGVNVSECILHVPSGSIEMYKQYPVWNSFTNIVEQ